MVLRGRYGLGWAILAWLFLVCVIGLGIVLASWLTTTLSTGQPPT